MDHYGMRAAMNRALGLPEPTEAFGMPAQITVRSSRDLYFHDLIQRLNARHALDDDLLSKEAAEVIAELTAPLGQTYA
jgi:hypothetical protein